MTTKENGDKPSQTALTPAEEERLLGAPHSQLHGDYQLRDPFAYMRFTGNKGKSFEQLLEERAAARLAEKEGLAK